MPCAQLLSALGGPEELVWTEVAVGEPGPDDLVIRQTFAGLNYADVLTRRGRGAQTLPAIPGVDGVGVVEHCGAAVREFSIEDRVAYTMLPGAFSEARLIPAARAIKLPPAIGDRTAIAILSKGLTAHYLLHDVYPVGPADTILVHAAAGGVGTCLSQWASAKGARVIGTVSTRAKASFAEASGCQHVIVRNEEDCLSRVLEITRGARLPVVYDSIGRDTFQASLDCLRPRGLMVSFGQSSGPVAPFAIDELGRRGSLQLTQTGLMTFIPDQARLNAASQAVFDAVQEGSMRPVVEGEYRLQDAARAHRDLESGTTVGTAIFRID
jgi:NADPH:quinone reductase